VAYKLKYSVYHPVALYHFIDPGNRQVDAFESEPNLIFRPNVIRSTSLFFLPQKRLKISQKMVILGDIVRIM